jgi:hypothetical protein
VQQRRQADDYRRFYATRETAARERAQWLRTHNRPRQYQYQQDYYRRLRDQQSHWISSYNIYNDPFYYTPASYRYYRDGRYYSVNRYAADLLQDAIRRGYEEGFRAGQADRYDGWRPDYRSSFVYQDGIYGYHGFYVSRSEYNHYFRQGFRRGYEDGYYDRYRYGRYHDGRASILQAVLAMILALQVI